MKIISINQTKSWGIRDPQNGKEYQWELDDDDDDPALFHSSLITAVIPHEYPDDTTFTNDEKFTSKWLAFYAECGQGVSTDELLKAFISPHFVLEMTTYGVACGPVSFTLYFILEKKYKKQLDSLILI